MRWAALGGVALLCAACGASSTPAVSQSAPREAVPPPPRAPATAAPVPVLAAPPIPPVAPPPPPAAKPDPHPLIAAYFKALDGWVTDAERPRVATDLGRTADADGTRLAQLVQDRVGRELAPRALRAASKVLAGEARQNVLDFAHELGRMPYGHVGNVVTHNLDAAVSAGACGGCAEAHDEAACMRRCERGLAGVAVAQFASAPPDPDTLIKAGRKSMGDGATAAVPETPIGAVLGDATNAGVARADVLAFAIRLGDALLDRARAPRSLAREDGDATVRGVAQGLLRWLPAAQRDAMARELAAALATSTKEQRPGLERAIVTGVLPLALAAAPSASVRKVGSALRKLGSDEATWLPQHATNLDIAFEPDGTAPGQACRRDSGGEGSQRRCLSAVAAVQFANAAIDAAGKGDGDAVAIAVEDMLITARDAGASESALAKLLSGALRAAPAR